MAHVTQGRTDGIHARLTWQLKNTTISNDGVLGTLHVIILKETKDGNTTLILEACTEIILKKFFPLNSFLEGTNLLH